MEKFKIYLHLKGNIDEIVKKYAYIFDAQIYKNNSYDQEDINRYPELKPKLGQSYFSVLRLFKNKDLMILVSQHSDKFIPPFGTNCSVILSLDTNKDCFNSTYERMKKDPDFKMIYDKDTWNSWGTQIVCFEDKWSVRWILELDTRKVDNNWKPVRIEDH
jgi:uncharacterized glyoxalase superfamily protein PhnB